MSKDNLIQKYRDFLIVPVKSGGYDVIDQATGKWVWRPTERSARWWAGTWSRIDEIITTSKPKALPRKGRSTKVIKVRKLKGLRTSTPAQPR